MKAACIQNPLKFALFRKGSKARVITAMFTILLHVAQIEINVIPKVHRNCGRNSTSVLWFVASWLLGSSCCSSGCVSISRPALHESPFPSVIRIGGGFFVQCALAVISDVSF